MTALGYDRLVTASMIIVGATIGIMGSTVNPFSIGVAAGEAGIGIGDGIVLRLVLWVALTAMAVGWVLRYAVKVRRDPSASLIGFEDVPIEDESAADLMAEDLAANPTVADERLTGTQKWVLAITVFSFGLMIFSVIPWSSLIGGTTGPADYYVTHEVAGVRGYWFQLDWWFPQLAMLFILMSVIVGLVARMDEKEIVRLIAVGASDMMKPAIVMLLAGGVSVHHDQHPDPRHNPPVIEKLIAGASAGTFAVATMLVNIPLAFLIPVQFRSRHAGDAAALPSGRLCRREPSHHHHRLDYGPRSDPAGITDQCRCRCRSGHRKG